MLHLDSSGPWADDAVVDEQKDAIESLMAAVYHHPESCIWMVQGAKADREDRIQHYIGRLGPRDCEGFEDPVADEMERRRQAIGHLLNWQIRALEHLTDEQVDEMWRER